MSFAERKFTEAEAMDAPDAGPKALQKALLFLRRINFFVGWNNDMAREVVRVAQAGRTPATDDQAARLTGADGGALQVLDVAAGSADLSVHLQRHAQKHGGAVAATALDMHPVTLDLARTWVRSRGEAVRFVRGDALRLPFADGAFDVAVCSTFLHHLPDDESAIALLREMDRVSRLGLVLADLVRSRRAYTYVTVMGLFAGRMVFHDGRVSVRQAYRPAEVLRLRDAAGLGYLALRETWTHRFILAGSKHA